MANQPKFHLKRTDETRDRWIETKGRFARHPILKRANRSWRRLSTGKSVGTSVFPLHCCKKKKKQKRQNEKRISIKRKFDRSEFLCVSFDPTECPSLERGRKWRRKTSPFAPFIPLFRWSPPPPWIVALKKRTPSSKRCQNLIEDQCIYAVY